MSAIRGSQNRIAGINRLPEEILGYIFEVLADLVRDDTEMRLRSSWRNLPQERWLQINLVCRHWRRIALSRPALWTCIYFGAPNKDPSGNDLTAMSLGRSGILPLSGYCIGDPTTCAHWIDHAERFRELHISGPWRSIHDVPDSRPSVWAEKTPSLEVLVVENSPSLFDDFESDESPTWTLPHLRTLIWTGLSERHLGVFGNLRRLVLLSTPIPSARDLIDTLAANPFLEDLIIHSVEFSIPIHEEVPVGAMLPQTSHKLVLPALKRMDISVAGPPYLFCLLDRQLAKRSGTARSFSFTASGDVNFPSLLVNEDSGVHIDRVYVNATRLIAYDDNSTLSFYHMHTVQDQHEVEDSTIQLQFSWMLNMLRRSQLIRELWLSILLRDNEDIYNSLGLLQDVERLVLVVDDPYRSWLDFLADNSTFLPSLTHLHVDMVSSSSLFSPRLVSIIKLLLARKKTPCPIRSLHVVQGSDEPDLPLTAADLAPYVDVVTIETVDSEESREPLHLRMGLPALFTTPSPIHTFWEGWAGPPLPVYDLGWDV